jgi:hypothetical protein
VAVGHGVGVANSEPNAPAGSISGEAVAVGGNGCGVAVTVSVTHSVGVELAVGVQVADGVAVGSGVSVTRPRMPNRGAARLIKTRATIARTMQPTSITIAPRPPPTTSIPTLGRLVGSPPAAL